MCVCSCVPYVKRTHYQAIQQGFRFIFWHGTLKTNRQAEAITTVATFANKEIKSGKLFHRTNPKTQSI